MPDGTLLQDATDAGNNVVRCETRGLIDNKDGIHQNSIIESFRDLIIVESQDLIAVTRRSMIQ
jgi:hypothetical protein